MRNVLAFARQVRHVPPAQLAARVRLGVRRRLLCSPLGSWWRPSPAATPPRAERPPLAVFPPRRDLVVEDEGRTSLAFLNLTVPWSRDLDWSPAAWVADPQLEILHLHYMEWLEALDDDAFAASVASWIGRVRPYGPRYWRGGWNSYALSIRVVVWMQQLAARAPRLRLDFLEQVHASLAEQMAFLERNLEVDIRGNHLIKNVKALAWAAAYFDGADARRWRRLAERHLARELDAQFLADGHHFERSPAYHAQVCADLIEIRVALGATQAAERLDEVLARALQALADLTHPDGRVSSFSDGGQEMGYSPDAILDAYRRIGGAPPVSRRHVALEDVGYYGWREGRSLFLFDCGDLAADDLPAHGHGDALAFEWTLHGERVFVDAGVFEYRAGDRRTWSRSTRAHNTVTLDDQDQGEFVGSFRLGRRARVRRTRLQILPDGIVVEGVHDGYEHLRGAPLHRRLVRASSHDLRIEDRIEGGAGQCVRARLLCHPSARVSQSADGVVTIRQGRVVVRVVSESPITVEDAQWFPDFGLALRTKQIVVDHGSAPRVGAITATSLVRAPHGSVAVPHELAAS